MRAPDPTASEDKIINPGSTIVEFNDCRQYDVQR